MQQTALSLSPTPRCQLSRDALAQRALGATVLFYTDGEPDRWRKGRVTFADVDTLHLLVEDYESEELVPLTNCRVLEHRQESVASSFVRLNVWQFGKGWRGYAASLP